MVGNATKTTVRAGGYEVTLTDAPGRPLILLIRMASPEAGMWDRIWADVAAHFSVATFDLQQVEAASRGDDPQALFRATAAACVAVAAGLGTERFHLFGWNGGTQIAMRAAVDFPQRIASLLLLDPFFELPDMRHVDKAVRFKQLLFEQDPELYAYYWVMAGLSDGFIANHFDQVERLAEARIRSDRFLRQDPERFVRWVRALRRNWLTSEDFARIRCPSLILATGLDRWSAGPSVAMAEAVQARIPGAELAAIDGVGGHFLIEKPERLLDLAGAFIARVTGTEPG